MFEVSHYSNVTIARDFFLLLGIKRVSDMTLEDLFPHNKLKSSETKRTYERQLRRTYCSKSHDVTFTQSIRHRQ